MDWTDVHYRQLARLISRHTWLWTEMVVDNTLIHQPSRDRFGWQQLEQFSSLLGTKATINTYLSRRWLWFPPEQHPIVCQLGGSNPTTLAAAAKIVEEYGYAALTAAAAILVGMLAAR